jgi:hypothetical protein
MNTEDLMSELTMEYDSILELAEATRAILADESKGRNIEKPSSIVYIDFSMPNEFVKLGSIKMKLPQILAIYHDWASRTYDLAYENKGRLKKGKLREYIEKCLLQVQTLQGLFNQNQPPKPTSR